MKLRLESLELSGFKSFVNPVKLEFPGGITAIVGPNGCGKSNLTEAVTWSLGEQSAKSLRGAKMEDVIFAGAEKRRRLGMAEATLTLAADPSFEAAEDGKIVIHRRVFRTGESQYRLNGKLVRLKDVKSLLMDTGLGIRAYSVIEQGKIGMILSGKPQERRRLLEEAAGITRYKTRKRVAEVKLSEAEANLMRLDDIISEVERALRSLKRQAGAARRYQEREAEYHTLLEGVLLGRWSKLHHQLLAIRDRLVSAGNNESQLAADLARDEAQLTAGRERLDELSIELAEKHERQAELAARIEGRQEFLKATRGSVDELAQRAAVSLRMADQREKDDLTHSATLNQLAARRQELQAELAGAQTEVGRDEQRLAKAEQRLATGTALIEEKRALLLEAVGQINSLRNRLHQEEIELEKGNYRQSRLSEEIDRQAHQLKTAQEALEVAREGVEELAQKLAEQRRQRDALARQLEETVRREAEATEQRQRLEEELSTARQRQNLLEELNKAHAEKRTRLEEALAAAGIATPHYLAEHLRAAPGWERGLDFYLGTLADAVILDDEQGPEPLALARALAGGRAGASLLRPLPAGTTPRHEIDDTAVHLSLGEALGLPESLAAALPPAYLVENAADAARLARLHPGVAFISRQQVWAAGGLLHVEGAKSQPGLLQRERELAELDERSQRLEQELTTALAEVERLVAERAQKAQQARQLDQTIAGLAQQEAVSRARLQDSEAQHQRLQAQHAAMVEEQGEIGGELAKVRQRRERLQADVVRSEARHVELQSAFDRTQEEAEAAKAEREELRTETASHRGRLELVRERIASHDREAERLKSEIQDGLEQVKLWRHEAERLEQRRREQESGIETAQGELSTALEQRSASQEVVLEAQRRLDQHRGLLKNLEGRIAATRENHDRARAGVEELRIGQASLSEKADHVTDLFLESFQRHPLDPPDLVRVLPSAEPTESDEARGNEEAVADSVETGEEAERVTAAWSTTGEEGEEPPTIEPASADEAQQPEPLPPIPQVLDASELPPVPEELDEMEADLSRLKATLERLGPVNLLAVQEYAEQEERHAFLTEQRADVVASMESLRKTIREINATSSDRFRETFAEVNTSFGSIFQRLFRGGEAQMRLLDEDDVLESGIEIVARPPGKRLQNIMLMSGGEKALTAIALLFALFQTKPSPFCILDEVDAPLDDANAVRFVELLAEMAGETQFIVITHNKITMEIAHTLYGVTMQERGVSQLVSVEMDEVQPASRATA